MKRMTSTVLVVLLGVATLAPAAVGRAQAVEEEAAAFQPDKAFDLAACAVSLIGVTTGIGAVAAALTCGRAAYTWWSK